MQILCLTACPYYIQKGRFDARERKTSLKQRHYINCRLILRNVTQNAFCRAIRITLLSLSLYSSKLSYFLSSYLSTQMIAFYILLIIQLQTSSFDVFFKLRYCKNPGASKILFLDLGIYSYSSSNVHNVIPTLIIICIGCYVNAQNFPHQIQK